MEKFLDKKKVCAIICEYNPMHTGHTYLIEGYIFCQDGERRGMVCMCVCVCACMRVCGRTRAHTHKIIILLAYDAILPSMSRTNGYRAR